MGFQSVYAGKRTYRVFQVLTFEGFSGKMDKKSYKMMTFDMMRLLKRFASALYMWDAAGRFD
jgi:hypothetical protein